MLWRIWRIYGKYVQHCYNLVESQLIQASLYLFKAAGMFSFIIRQFDTFSPFLIDIHLTLCQFHHDVRRLESGIIGKVGTDSERAAYFVLAVFLNIQCLCKVEGIAENDGFGRRINSQLSVTGNQLVDKLKLITGIATHSVK